jgi:hypothetical protein
MAEHVYPMVPASGGAFGLLIPTAILVLGASALLAYALWSARHTRFVVSSSGLQIQGDIYGRTIPFNQVIQDEVRVVDLTTDTDLKPGWRTNGIGVPGYKSGWFRLRNGDKALLFVTDLRRVLAIPTREGYTVLLSAQDPEGLLADLRQRP